MVKERDFVTFTKTPKTLQRKIKVFAFTNTPSNFEYKNKTWYGDGQRAILVSDGMKSYGLPKRYKHVDFYIMIGDNYFHNGLQFDKEDQGAAYNIELSVNKAYGSYVISGTVTHNNKSVLSFSGHSFFKRNQKGKG